MKKPLFFLLFAFLFIKSQAQTSWSPMHADKIYTFQYNEDYDPDGDILVNDDLLYYSFWVDSSWTANGDTIFSINNPLGKDDFIIHGCGYSISSYQWYEDGNHFLQQQIIKKSDNEYHFAGLDTFVLQPQSGLNDSWAFTPSITATVVALTDTLLWSAADSLKTIQLSNGEYIKLSRNYGILQFPHPDSTQNRVLAGWEQGSTYKGLKIPDVMDFYNFEVGDVFMYEIRGNRYHNYIWTVYDGFDKKYILDKTTLNDGYRYIIQRFSKIREDYIYDIFEQSIDTVEYTYSNTSCNGYPVRFDSLPRYSNYDLRNVLWSESSTNEFYKLAAIGHHYPVDSCFRRSESFKYEIGLGHSYYKYLPLFLPEEYREDLIGYIKSGDTTGTMMSDYFMTPVEKIESQSPLQAIQLYPNPSSDGSFTLRMEDSVQEVDLQIYNQLGQLCFSKTIQNQYNTAQVHTGLAKGLYFVVLRTKQEQVTCKWQVNN